MIDYLMYHKLVLVLESRESGIALTITKFIKKKKVVELCITSIAQLRGKRGKKNHIKRDHITDRIPLMHFFPFQNDPKENGMKEISISVN